MGKTEMMKRYEEETDIDAIIPAWAAIHDVEMDEICNPEYTSYLERQLEEAQAKAEAYDRLMSGGKKTLKEWANIFGMVVAVDQNGEASCFGHIPVIIYHDEGEGIWTNNPEHYGEETYLLPPHLIDFDGDWMDSLTLPDGWEEA